MKMYLVTPLTLPNLNNVFSELWLGFHSNCGLLEFSDCLRIFNSPLISLSRYFRSYINTVSDPHKSPLPVRCYKQHDKSYWVEFTPEHVGSHVIDVTFGDAPISGSPFHCEVVDPKKIKVRGLNGHHPLRHVAHVTSTFNCLSCWVLTV